MTLTILILGTIVIGLSEMAVIVGTYQCWREGRSAGAQPLAAAFGLGCWWVMVHLAGGF